jgi:hypothetical protein
VLPEEEESEEEEEERTDSNTVTSRAVARLVNY